MNKIGLIAQGFWKAVPNVTMGEFVIMPNHVHGIIYIVSGSDVGAIHKPVGAIHKPVGAIHKPVGAIHELPILDQEERRKMILPKRSLGALK